jgi:peroxiredoxin family protein
LLNIATASAATNAEVAIFFTFEGLQLIHKEAHHNLPLPAGKEALAQGFQKANIPAIPELVKMAQELGVKLIACQMTMDVMGLTKEDFVDGIEVGGAVTFLDFAKDANVSLSF